MDACAGEMAQNNCRLAVDPQGGHMIYKVLVLDRREAKINLARQMHTCIYIKYRISKCSLVLQSTLGRIIYLICLTFYRPALIKEYCDKQPHRACGVS